MAKGILPWPFLSLAFSLISQLVSLCMHLRSTSLQVLAIEFFLLGSLLSQISIGFVAKKRILASFRYNLLPSRKLIRCLGEVYEAEYGISFI